MIREARRAWSRRVAALGLVALAFATARARADVVTLDSLEWSISAADAVIDGSVAEWRALAGDEWFLRVTPRAPGQAEVLFRIPRGSVSVELGERVVAFGRSVEGWGHSLDRLLQGDGAVAMTRTGEELRGLDAIAARVRELGRLRRSRAVLLPIERGLDETASLRVPADRETELLLRARLASPNPGERAVAASLLEPFESTANIARLRALLDDRTTFPGSATPIVCVHAARTLAVWEVPLPAAPCEVTASTRPADEGPHGGGTGAGADGGAETGALGPRTRPRSETLAPMGW